MQELGRFVLYQSQDRESMTVLLRSHDEANPPQFTVDFETDSDGLMDREIFASRWDAALKFRQVVDLYLIQGRLALDPTKRSATGLPREADEA